MKFTILALTTLIASASAIPTWNGGWKGKGKDDDAWKGKGDDWKGPKGDKKHWKGVEDYPKYFTSTYVVEATPEQVVNANNTFTGGLPGAESLYKYGINADCDVICYDIAIKGFRGEYQSPALTATHIHQGDVGRNGPPR